jgi:murein DD-endopeptidase MepM/ murein hydrolase activator NlpD
MGRLLEAAKEQGIKGPNGEWAWYWVPGEERFTKATLPPDAPSPPSNGVWPVARKAYWVPRFIAGKGPNSGGAFGYKRPLGGVQGRTHVGVDLSAKEGDIIRAVDDGQIVSFYWFTFNVYALFVQHSGYVINYGEVAANSLDHFGLEAKYRNYQARTAIKSTGKSGSQVKRGQPIALAGRMQRSSMLHLEIWQSGKRWGSQWQGFPTGSPPAGLYNPTNFVLQLSGKAVEAQPVYKEPESKDICR